MKTADVTQLKEINKAKDCLETENYNKVKIEAEENIMFMNHDSLCFVAFIEPVI